LIVPPGPLCRGISLRSMLPVEPSPPADFSRRLWPRLFRCPSGPLLYFRGPLPQFVSGLFSRQRRWQPEPSRSILVAPPGRGRNTLLEAFERLKAALGDCYAIGREIGSGGMATVYFAEEASRAPRPLEQT
jgi:hypothetical protein